MSITDNANLRVTLNKNFSKYVVFFGFLSIILGVLMLMYPLVTIEAVAYFFGAVLIFVGISQFVYAFNGHGSVLWKVVYAIVGILAVVLGISSFASQNPVYAVYLLATYIGVVWLMRGFVALFLSFQIKEAGLGILNFILAIVGIIAGLGVLVSPLFAGLTLTILVLITSIVLIVTGVFEIVGVFFIKHNN